MKTYYTLEEIKNDLDSNDNLIIDDDIIIKCDVPKDVINDINCNNIICQDIICNNINCWDIDCKKLYCDTLIWLDTNCKKIYCKKEKVKR